MQSAGVGFATQMKEGGADRDHPIHRDQRELQTPATPVGSGEDGQHHDADEHEPQDGAPPLGPVFEVEEDGLNGVVGNTVSGCRR